MSTLIKKSWTDSSDYTNQGHKFWWFIGQSYLKITLQLIRTQNLGSLLLKLSQSNFNLWSPDSDSVRSYLIATVNQKKGAMRLLSENINCDQRTVQK